MRASNVASKSGHNWLAAIALSIVALSFGNLSFAAKDKGKVFTLKEINDDSDANTTRLSVILDKDPGWKKVHIENHGSFIQIKLPNTLIPESGNFFDTTSKVVRKVVAFQTSATDSALRLFLAKKADDVRKEMHADVLANRLEITIDQAKLLKDMTPATAEIPSADEVIARTKVRHSDTSPAELLKTSDSPLAIAGWGNTELDDQLRRKMITATIFLSILILGMLGLYFARPYLIKNNWLKRDSVREVDMTTLATHMLSAKQKLAVVEVSGEKILLGITPDQISYIKTIGSPQMALQAPVQMSAPMNRNPYGNSSLPRTRSTPTKQKAPEKRVRPAQTKNVPEKTESKAQKTNPPQNPQNESAIDDVTKLIRQKLGSLPQLP